MFLATGRGLLDKRQYAQAAAALRRAMDNDAALIEAHYYLAKAHQDMGRTQEAVAEYRQFLSLLAGRPQADDALAKLAGDAERHMNRLDVFAAQWRTVRADQAKQLRALAGRYQGSVSAVRALEIAAGLSPDDAEIAPELEAARKLLPAALPDEPAEPDDEGAKLLLERASSLVKSGQNERAAQVLRQAAGLCRDPQLMVAAAEDMLAAGLPADASLLIDDAMGRLDAVAVDDRTAVENRLLLLQRKADPGAVKLSLLLAALASRGERIARQAMARKDYDTAEEILTHVLKLLPQRPSAQKLLAKIQGAPPTEGRLPDLTSEAVKVSPANANSTMNVSRHAVEITGKAGDRGLAGGALTFQPLRWGRSIEATWRLKILQPSPENGEGYVQIRFWPMLPGNASFCVNPKAKLASPYNLGAMKNCKIISGQTDAKQAQSRYRPDGVYEVTFAKENESFKLTVNGELLGEVALDSPPAAEEPVVLRISVGTIQGHPVHVQATLVDFSCSKDCIK